MINILIAEDDADLRLNMTEILELEGYQVTAVNSAEAAIIASQSNTFDIALLDLVMQGMTGVEVISHLRQVNPFLAVVIITAYATVDTAVDAMKKGADGFITKPFNIAELLINIKRTLAEKELFKPAADVDVDSVYAALANPVRREALKHLSCHKSMKFMDLCRLVGVEDHTKFNFHLQQLKKAGLVEQNVTKVYVLTATGRFILQNHKLC